VACYAFCAVASSRLLLLHSNGYYFTNKSSHVGAVAYPGSALSTPGAKDHRSWLVKAFQVPLSPQNGLWPLRSLHVSPRLTTQGKAPGGAVCCDSRGSRTPTERKTGQLTLTACRLLRGRSACTRNTQSCHHPVGRHRRAQSTSSRRFSTRQSLHSASDSGSAFVSHPSH
jgi:hypothetical protein